MTPESILLQTQAYQISQLTQMMLSLSQDIAKDKAILNSLVQTQQTMEQFMSNTQKAIELITQKEIEITCLIQDNNQTFETLKTSQVDTLNLLEKIKKDLVEISNQQSSNSNISRNSEKTIKTVSDEKEKIIKTDFNFKSKPPVPIDDQANKAFWKSYQYSSKDLPPNIVYNSKTCLLLIKNEDNYKLYGMLAKGGYIKKLETGELSNDVINWCARSNIII
jgi:hypothetical protein